MYKMMLMSCISAAYMTCTPAAAFLPAAAASMLAWCCRHVLHLLYVARQYVYSRTHDLMYAVLMFTYPLFVAL